MKIIAIKKGLNIPVSGKHASNDVTDITKQVREVAVVGVDYLYIQPKLFINVDDVVKQGTPLFYDKLNPKVMYTAPVSGKITAINRSERRVLESIVIKVDESLGSCEFNKYNKDELLSLTSDVVRENLLKSGLWTAFRERPFSHVPDADAVPSSIFITATDTNPLSVDPKIVIDMYSEDFVNGLKVISRLHSKKPYLCVSSNLSEQFSNLSIVETVCFTGAHPSGLAGTHIHFLDPVNKDKRAWHLNYQDVIAIAKLFTEGCIDSTRIVALSGDVLKTSRLVKTFIGTNLIDLIKAEDLCTDFKEVRIVSGSVISGRTARKNIIYLGRYHLQVSMIKEHRSREFLGWMSLGFCKYSLLNTVFSKVMFKPRLYFTTTTNGSRRAIVPIGVYERVFPLNIMITFLLKSLSMKNVDESVSLGCMELDEEDLALSTFVCPSKNDYSQMLRDVLDLIRRESTI